MDVAAPNLAYPPSNKYLQRKQARQRRDYLYRKAVLLRDAEVSEKRAKLRAALASGKPLDPELAKDTQLRKDYDYDASRDVAEDDSLDIDDEYSELSGVVGMALFCGW